MPNNEIAITFGKFNPPHMGHAALVQGLIDYAGDQGIPHMVYSSNKHLKPTKAKIAHKDAPLSPERKVVHLSRAFRTPNVELRTSPHHAIEELIKQGYDKIHLMLGSDRVDDTGPGLKERYGDKIVIVPFGAKREASATGIAGASSTKLRSHAASGDFSSFRAMLPEHMSEEHAKEMFDDVREGLKLAKEQVNEEVSAVTRMKLARVARRTAKRRAILRRARAKKRRTIPQLKKRAKNEVTTMLRKVFTGKKNWKNLIMREYNIPPLSEATGVNKRLSPKQFHLLKSMGS